MLQSTTDSSPMVRSPDPRWPRCYTDGTERRSRGDNLQQKDVAHDIAASAITQNALASGEVVSLGRVESAVQGGETQ